MLIDSASFVDHWKNVRARTLRVLDRISEDDLEWTYAPGKLTFGDLFRHLAGIERYMYAENVRQRPSRYPGHSAELAAGLPAVRAYVERAHGEAVAIFGGLSPEQLAARCLTPAGTPITVWKWLRAMVEHEAHHRGQLHVMAAMRGHRLPPLFGLTEEEVLRLSTTNSSDGPAS